MREALLLKANQLIVVAGKMKATEFIVAVDARGLTAGSKIQFFVVSFGSEVEYKVIKLILRRAAEKSWS